MSLVHYYQRKQGTTANPWTIAVTYGKIPDRSNNHKGIKESMWVMCRSMTGSEIENFENSWRFMTYFYTTKDELIEDETRCNLDHETMIELKNKIK
ncbi:hypothetical protein [Reichenbachiella sp.]|uniref:hypothetical protein n=1 Tax=Reichenbachiella sp. TaxID=2184521 RepID=UPI003B5A38F7